jgi:hypothetical protein
MDAIQQTVRIDSGRRHLWLDEPLPETFPCGTARVELRFISAPQPEQPRRRHSTGFLKGQISCPADFDTMGQEEIIALFEGES